MEFNKFLSITRLMFHGHMLYIYVVGMEYILLIENATVSMIIKDKDLHKGRHYITAVGTFFENKFELKQE